MPGPGQGTGLVSQMSQAWARAAESHSGRRNAGETEACIRTSKNFESGKDLPLPGHQTETPESLYWPRKCSKYERTGDDVLGLHLELTSASLPFLVP